MKASELAELIKKEVKVAIREELVDILREAVLIASTPQQSTATLKVPSTNNTRADTTSTAHLQYATTTGLRPIADLMEQTRLNFTAQDAKTFIAPSQRDMFTTENKSAAIAAQLGMDRTGAGLDITQLPFVKTAKLVLDLANEKDKSRGL